jgi:chemotaxis protein MotD
VGRLPPEWFIARAGNTNSDEKQPDKAAPEGPDGKDGPSAKDKQAGQNVLMTALQAAGTGSAATAEPGSTAGANAAFVMDGLSAQPENKTAMAGKDSAQPQPPSKSDGPPILPPRSTITSSDAASPRTDPATADAPPDLQPKGVTGRPSAKSDEQSPRTVPVGAHPAAERVSVVAAQSIPAPVHHQIGQTALGLVGAIASDTNWQTMLPAHGTAALATPSSPGPAHMLKIELHPAELGMVQVGLRLAGGQLSIEITPQTHEAWRHLASDTDTIARSMRDLGFDVGKITLLQPALAAVASARPDAGGGLASAGRDQSFQQQGQAGSGGSNGQQSGQGHGQEQGGSHRAWTPERSPAGRGLVI